MYGFSSSLPPITSSSHGDPTDAIVHAPADAACVSKDAASRFAVIP